MKTKKSNVEKITVNNVEITEPQLIADEFNNFFTEIGSKILTLIRISDRWTWAKLARYIFVIF